jgi:outer membrane lipoprotein-sorting protein
MWSSGMLRMAGLLLVLSAAGCDAFATPKRPAAAEDSAASGRAVEITERMLKKYREAASYADRATYVEQSVLRGEGVEHELPFFQMSLAFQRPNRLRLVFEEAVAGSAGRKGYDIASDGRRLRTAAKEIPDQIQEAEAPATLTAANFVTDPTVREALLERELGDVFPQLAMLLNPDGQTPVFPRDSHPRLLDDETLRGRRCWRVASTNPDGTRVLWIDKENDLLVRMELPVAGHRRAIDPDNNYLNLRVWIDFEDVSFDVPIDAESFELKTPPGARRVTRFVPPPLEEEGQTDADKSAAQSRFQRDLEAATLPDRD